MDDGCLHTFTNTASKEILVWKEGRERTGERGREGEGGGGGEGGREGEGGGRRVGEGGEGGRERRKEKEGERG